MSCEVVVSEFVAGPLRLLLARNPIHLAALNILLRYPEGLSVEEFDRFNEPHGEKLRLDLAPLLLRVKDGAVTITAVGKFAIEEADQPPWNAAP